MKLDLNALQQAIDTTWGRSSTPKTSSFSIKMSINQNCDLSIQYSTIVNFGSEGEMIQMKRMHQGDADQLIDKSIKSVKSRYKDICGNSLNISVDSSCIEDTFELTELNIHNKRKTALFRRFCIATIKK
jgi:hypothetical protein